MARAQAFVFDAYGTLFDVHSVVAALRDVTVEAESLSLQWRAKQLEYSWLHSLMGRYDDGANGLSLPCRRGRQTTCRGVTRALREPGRPLLLPLSLYTGATTSLRNSDTARLKASAFSK
jgi:hypothetical protein